MLIWGGSTKRERFRRILVYSEISFEEKVIVVDENRSYSLEEEGKLFKFFVFLGIAGFLGIIKDFWGILVFL